MLSKLHVRAEQVPLFHHIPSARSQEAAFEQLGPVHWHGGQDSMAEPSSPSPNHPRTPHKTTQNTTTTANSNI